MVRDICWLAFDELGIANLDLPLQHRYTFTINQRYVSLFVPLHRIESVLNVACYKVEFNLFSDKDDNNVHNEMISMANKLTELLTESKLINKVVPSCT